MKKFILSITVAVFATLAWALPASASGGHQENGFQIPKVTICHKEEGKRKQTLQVSILALPAHLAHGDTLGACPVYVPKPPVVICYKGETLTVKAKKVGWYLSKGATRGECPEEEPEPLPEPENPPTTPFTPQENRTGWCFQTKNQGWTFVDLTSDFSPVKGASWFDLYLAEATVVLDGHEVTFAGWESWRKDGGILPAPNIPGVGLTCDNPWLSAL
jgi:hypothetical protein